jgi:hypothetical protein
MRRRDFFRRALLAGAAPWVVPAGALGRDGGVAASERITLGAVGLGSPGRSDLAHFLDQNDVRCVAVCHTFADRRAQGKEMVDKHYGNTDCAATRFHEELLKRDDLDALLVVTGDRWHAVLSPLAARAGKDAHCANLCLRLGRKLRWDAAAERFVGDREANRFLDRSMRVPWRV